MKARPRLAWPGSKPDPPCQLDEDGREIDRVHGPARREHEQVFVGPAAALPLPEIRLPWPDGRCPSRGTRRRLPNFAFLISKPSAVRSVSSRPVASERRNPVAAISPRM